MKIFFIRSIFVLIFIFNGINVYADPLNLTNTDIPEVAPEDISKPAQTTKTETPTEEKSKDALETLREYVPQTTAEKANEAADAYEKAVTDLEKAKTDPLFSETSGPADTVKSMQEANKFQINTLDKKAKLAQLQESLALAQTDEEKKALNTEITSLTKEIQNGDTSTGALVKSAENLQARDDINAKLAAGEYPEKDIPKMRDQAAVFEKQAKVYQAEVNCLSVCSEDDSKTLQSARHDLAVAKSNLSAAIQQQQAKFKVNLSDYGIVVGKVNSIEKLAENIIRFLARVIAALGVLGVVIGGFLLMVRLDDDGREQGKKIIKYSLLAIVIVLGAYVIVSAVQQVLYSLGK